MNFLLVNFIVALWVTAISTFLLGVFVYSRNRKNITNITFSLYSVSIAWWSFCQIWLIACDKRLTALIWTRIEQIGVFFIPTFFVHFVISFLGIKDKKWFIRLGYFLSLFFAVLCPTRFMMADAVPKFYVKHFATPGFAYHFAILFFFVYVTYGLKELFKEYFHSIGTRKNQLKYLCWSSLVGYIGGGANFLLVYDISIPVINPFGTYALPLYVTATAYAIIKYRLIPIEEVIALTMAFIIICVPIVAIPFVIGYFTGFWFISTILATILAPTALYIYNRAKGKVLTERLAFQSAVTDIIESLKHTRTLDELLNTIIMQLVQKLKIFHASLYILNPGAGYYELKSSENIKTLKEKPRTIYTINNNNPVIEFLNKNKEPLIYDELRVMYHNANNISLKNIEEELSLLGASVMLPVFYRKDNEEVMIVVLTLGERRSYRPYGENEIKTLKLLSDHISLAIANAEYVEKKQEKKAQDMAMGAAHQLKNTLGGILSQAESVYFKIRKKEVCEIGQEDAHKILKLSKMRLPTIIEYCKDGLRKLDAILYPAKAKGDFAEVNIYEAVKHAADSSARLKSKYFLEKNRAVPVLINKIPQNFPSIIARATIINEILENLINNAYDAIDDKYAELRLNPNSLYRGKITITGEDRGAKIAINIEDNGIGIKEEDKSKIFVAFHTTKNVSGKGTGAGLRFVYECVKEHNGNISFRSERGKGSVFTMELPKIQGGR